MEIGIVLGVVFVALVLFAIEAIPIEFASLTVVALLAATGILTPQEAFNGFSNDTVIFIFTLLAMTQGLASTGVVQLIGQRLSFFARFGHQTFVLAMMGTVTAFSAVISNTVTTAAFLPVAIGAANRAKVPTSKVLMPLAYASMLGGTILLFGTSTNLVVSAALKQSGLPPIGITELTPLGIPIALIGILVTIILGPLLLPVRTQPVGAERFTLRDYLTEVVLTRDSRYVGKPLSEITAGLGLRVVGLCRTGEGAIAPKPTHILSLDDRLIVEGRRDDILRIKDLVGIEIKPDMKLTSEDLHPKDAVLVEATVPLGSPLVNRTLKETLFSERFGLVALAIHRRPAIQRVTKLQLIGRVFGGNSLSALSLSAGDVLLLSGPKDRVAQLNEGGTLVVLSDIEYQAPRYAKAALAGAIFITTLSLGTFEVLPLSVAGLCGMLLMIATGCVDSRLAFRVDWRVVLLIGSMMALGFAMEKSGAGAFLGGLIANWFSFAGPRTIMFVLMVLTIVLSAPMSNQAAALVVLPIAVATALQLGVDPRPFAIAICMSASCSFITPLEPSCVMVYGPGNYRFTDFFRVGTPLTAILLVLLAFGIPRIWPLDGGPDGIQKPTRAFNSGAAPAVPLDVQP